MGQTSDGIPNGGLTAHYQISYDTSLSVDDGLRRAQGLFHECEFDFDLMAEWFAGVNFEFSFPISVQINNATGGASWDDPPDISLPFGYSPTVQINPGSGTSVEFIRYLLVSEVTEMFMASKNNGWFESSSLFNGADEGSKGEGLSRFLAYQFLAARRINERYPTFDVVGLWLNGGRPDHVDDDQDDHAPDPTTGCAAAFIHYLHYQLGFAITDIINAGTGTLAGVYTNLTRRTDAWTSFFNLVSLHYPPSRSYNLVSDKIFPVPNLSSLSDTTIMAGSTQTARIVTLDTQAPGEVTIRITSDDTSALNVPDWITIPPGDWAAGIDLTAGDLTGPERFVQIHATYAGKTLTSTVGILPRPATLAGRVTDQFFNPVPDATVLIKSDIIIDPGHGNTLQLSTDANGFYQSPALPPHTYQVEASDSDFVPQTRTVVINEGVPVTKQDFVLETIKPFTISGTVTDEAGNGIAQATLRLSPGPQITADDNGNYTITMNPGPYVGAYGLTASAAGYEPSSIQLATIPNGAVLTESFQLEALGSLAGFVGDASVTPIAAVIGARVTIGSQIMVTGPDGMYQIDGLAPGNTEVNVSANGYDSIDEMAVVVSGTVTKHNFLLNEATAAITGTVTDSDTGATLRSAAVRVGGIVTTVRTDGTYTISGLPAGQLKVTATAPAHFPDTTTVQLVDHQTLQLDFQLDPTRRPPFFQPGGGPLRYAERANATLGARPRNGRHRPLAAPYARAENEY